MLDEVRQELINEARQSSSLLSEIAGLETYVAESYHARSFLELLQNADDAGARRFVMHLEGTRLIVANDGRLFSQSDLLTLCRSASSNKLRGDSIGYRGIGFKSVVGVAERVHLLSGQLSLTFCRDLTRAVLPNATRVPLVRIPHSMLTQDVAPVKELLQQLIAAGLETIFILDVLDTARVQAELQAFDATSLLFLRSVTEARIGTAQAPPLRVTRSSTGSGEECVSISGNSHISEWRVRYREFAALAYRLREGRPIPAVRAESVVHAFLPTMEQTGLAVKLNGDVSTDPSRTRVVCDSITRRTARMCAELILDTFLVALRSDDAALVQAIVPTVDYAALTIQRPSFSSELMSILREVAGDQFLEVRLRPPWFNREDHQRIVDAEMVRSFSPTIEDVPGCREFLKFLGAREASATELLTYAEVVSLTARGAAELLVSAALKLATGQMQPSDFSRNARVWCVGTSLLSLDGAIACRQPVDAEFLDLVTSSGGALNDVQRIVRVLAERQAADVLVPTLAVSETSSAAPIVLAGRSTARASGDEITLRRWRSAEMHVVEALCRSGWSAEDVSKQNLGWDVQASRGGATVYVEVKSINYPGQEFQLTSNEVAAALSKGSAYRIALVREIKNVLEIAFIEDPARTIVRERRCEKWVDVCSNYPYNPQTMELTS